MGNVCASVDKHDTARELDTSPQHTEKQPSGEVYTAIDDADFQTIGSEPTTPNSAGEDKSFAYHSVASSAYVLPHHAAEGSRLNLQHYLLRQLFGGPNYKGPPEGFFRKEGLKVLDVGCGTGIWLAEMNRDFPGPDYYGVDLTTTTWAQTFQDASGTGKIHLLEGNVMQRLPFEDNTFDYVHQQYLVLGLPEAAWPGVIAELCRVLKPGGYLDIVELDGIPVWQGPKGDAAQKFQNSLKAIMGARGFNIHIAASLGRLVSQNGGYEHVRQLRRTAPLGWDGNIGELFLWDFKKGMGNLGPLAAPALGMTVDQWDGMLEETGENYTSSKVFYNNFRVCARKRLSPSA
ncbi:S-adenosyl-L-methionine-dependent methyltransferase [Cladochytrium replicatum]|nr:S-adenosyl-L-methionine-dependent methyltransferase [Cladochytrium replicatum]